MEIPKTTKDKPYIEFRIDKKGKIKLSATSDWWGGEMQVFHVLTEQKEILVSQKI